MSPKEPSQKKNTQPRKKRRKAKSNSPVSDKNGGQCVHSGGVSDSNKNNQANSSSGYQNPTFTFPYPFTQPPVMNFSQQMPFGVQQPGNMAQ